MSGSSPPDAAISTACASVGTRARKYPPTVSTSFAHIDRISPRWPADALEAMRDALESVEITAHVLDRLRRERILFALAQQLEPPAER